MNNTLNQVIVKVRFPNKDFTDYIIQDITIKCLGYVLSENDVMYKYDLPLFLYDKLVDTHNKYKSYQNYKNLKAEKDKQGISISGEDKLYLKKTITSKLVSQIVDEIENLSGAALALGARSNLNKKKKIFIHFNSKINHDKCNWTGGYKGEKTTIGFQFFIGYEVEEKESFWKKESILNYYSLICYKTGSLAKHDTGFQEGNHLEPLHLHNDRDRDDFIRSHYILDYTPEREKYFSEILEVFKNVSSNLNNFFTGIDNDNIDKMISEHTSLKLLNSSNEK